MDLVIDIGNSRAKLALFAADRVIRHGGVALNDTAGVLAFLHGVKPRRIAMGSVGHDTGWDAALGEIAPVVVLSGSSPAPLRIDYTTPASLGVDRLANAVGASALFPGRAVLVIDLGSCITYDLVDGSGRYLGGAISPGMHMRLRAMNRFSARLPLVDATAPSPAIGTSTEGSLLAGMHHGIAHELNGWVAACAARHGDLAVILTGGDAPRFLPGSKSGIFAVPLLTLLGLHVLLERSDGPDRTFRPAAGTPPPAGAER